MDLRLRTSSLVPLVALAALTACGSPSETDRRAGALDAEPIAEADPNTSPTAPTAPTAPPTVDPTALPTITSGEGITVKSVTRVSARAFDILLSTPNVSDEATSLGNGVRIVLPPDYATSGKRYPVGYVLHGMGGLSYMTFYLDGMLEQIASGSDADVILVLPDGGKGGWYTDWLDQSIAQKWETYHLTQLVPFIDRNLRTIADRSARGIIGASMGGLGAVRYAAEHPDLFGALASLSGAVNTERLGVQTAVIAPSVMFNLPLFGAFGLPGTSSPTWAKANPVRRAAQLANTATFLYVGNAGEDPAATAGVLGAAIVNQVSSALEQGFDRIGLGNLFDQIAASLPPPPNPHTDVTYAVVGPIAETIVRDATLSLHQALDRAAVGAHARDRHPG